WWSMPDPHDELGTASEQHRGELALLPESDLAVSGQRGLVVGVHVQAGGPVQVLDRVRDHGSGAGRAEAPSAPVRMHPYALDLSHGRREGADLGLENHFAVTEPRERPAAGDQFGHPGPVARATVTEPRVDPHLFD